MTKSEKLKAAMERLRWAQNDLDEIDTGGGASLEFAKVHVHNAMEILKEIDGN
jgi:3-phosphoglycerate kinase